MKSWSSMALLSGQLSLMAANLLLSLSLGYAGGLSVVGALTPAMLVFQLTCGVLQRALSEATLLASTQEKRRVESVIARWAVTAALFGGVVGACAAFVAASLVPGARLELVLAYAAGIPLAIALDIARAASVAVHAPRSAFADATGWTLVLAAGFIYFAASGEPLGICLWWTWTNLLWFMLWSLVPHRRMQVRGVLSWIRSQHRLLGSASVDSLLANATPLVALQITAYIAAPATLGAIRVLQQLFSPVTFVLVALRRILIFRRDANVRTSVRQDVRDGLIASGLVSVAAVFLGLAVILGRDLVVGLQFIPAGAVLVAAAVEKIALGFSTGCTLNRFVRGEFDVLLRARWVMLVASAILAPSLVHWWGASGYLLGSAAGLLGYAVMSLGLRPKTSTSNTITVRPSGETVQL